MRFFGGSILARKPWTPGVGALVAPSLIQFTTWDPAKKNAGTSLTNGNLTSTATTAGQACGVRSTTSRSFGLWYVEVKVDVPASDCVAGVIPASYDITAINAGPGATSNSMSVRASGTTNSAGATATNGLTTSWSAGQIMGIQYDLDSRTFRYRNVSTASAWSNWVALTGLSKTEDLYFAVGGNQTSSSTTNFGASAFVGTLPPGTMSWDGSQGPADWDATRSKTRITQIIAEATYRTLSSIRTTQIVAEASYRTPSKIRATQVFVELTRSTGGTATGTTLDLATSATTLAIYNDRLWLANIIGQNAANAKATTSHTTGKWVFAANLRQHSTSNAVMIGLALPSLSVSAQVGTTANSVAVWHDGAVYVNATTFASTIGANAALNYTGGGELQVATDFDAKLIWFRVGTGLWNNNASADPSTGVGGVSIAGITGTVIPTFLVGTTLAQNQDILTLNFGQFAFQNALPTGFSAWG